MFYLPAVVVLLFTLANIESGSADLLSIFGRGGYVSIDREDSPFLFWFAIILQLLGTAALFWIARWIDVAMAT